MPNPKPIESIEGIKAITVDDIRWHRCDIKSIALLGNTMLRQAAVEKGAAESILIRDGKATEGAGSNLFIVDNDGMVITPPHSNNLLGGITRDLIVELCHKNNIACKEVDVSVDELKNAAEIWMSSSTKEILPVLELDGQQVGNGQIGDKWKEVFKVYQAFKKEVESGDAS